MSSWGSRFNPLAGQVLPNLKRVGNVLKCDLEFQSPCGSSPTQSASPLPLALHLPTTRFNPLAGQVLPNHQKLKA